MAWLCAAPSWTNNAWHGAAPSPRTLNLCPNLFCTPPPHLCTPGPAQVERADISDGMVFALDNADAAGEVVDILAQALSLPETPVPLKVG